MGFELHIYSQDQNGSKQILQINYSIDCAGSLDPTCMKCYIKC